MASIRKRNGKWQVQVRRTVHGSASRTFAYRKDALAWARTTEADLESGRGKTRAITHTTLGKLLTRYRDEVVVHKRARATETRRIDRLLRDSLSRVSLSSLDATTLAAFRDRRVRDGVRTCRYDLTLIRHALHIARTEWGYALSANPVDCLRKPPLPPSRERRLNQGEFAALRRAASRGTNPWIWPMAELAIETAMRRGELLALRRADVDGKTAIAFLAQTKNGTCRRVPLSPRALDILDALPSDTPLVFPVTPSAARQAWDRICKRAGISGLHFHDLRHEAISRLFEAGLNVPEVALISGHRTPSQLFRYTQMRVQTVQRKLAGHATDQTFPALRLVHP